MPMSKREVQVVLLEVFQKTSERNRGRLGITNVKTMRTVLM